MSPHDNSHSDNLVALRRQYPSLWFGDQSQCPAGDAPRALQHRHCIDSGPPQLPGAHFGPTDSTDLGFHMHSVAMSRATSDLLPTRSLAIPTSTPSVVPTNFFNHEKRDFHHIDMDFSHSYTYGSNPWTGSSVPPTTSHYRPDHVQVYDPAEYCSQLLGGTSSRAAPFTAKKQKVTNVDPNNHILSTPSDYASTLCVPLDMSPSTSMSTHLPTASLASGEAMSRQSSVTSASVIDALDMIRDESSFSHASDFFTVDDVDASFVSSLLETPASSQTTTSFQDGRATNLLSNVGFGLGCADFSFVRQDFSAAVSATAVGGGHQDAHETVPSFALPLQAQDMQRTESEGSTSSTSSADTKASERRRKHIENAKQSIAPKSIPAGPTSSRELTMPAAKTKASTAAHDPIPKPKEAIPKASYIRPQHPKLYCTLCEKFPAGFRGEHELRRHCERAHAECRKVWICIEPTTRTKWWPQKPLHTCKQCKQGKQYNVYYNAAAHLRRAHFCPRKRGRKAKGEERESRAGKAGGDWPPIDWLKANGWLKEIEISSVEDDTEHHESELADELTTLEMYPDDDFDDELIQDIGLDALGFAPSFSSSSHQSHFDSDYSTPIDSDFNVYNVLPLASTHFADPSTTIMMMEEHHYHRVPSAPHGFLNAAPMVYNTHTGFVSDTR